MTNNSFGFKSRKCPPQNNELDKFEADLLDKVHNVKFRNVNNKFQNKLNKDINKHRKRIFEPGQQAFPKETPLQQNLQ